MESTASVSKGCFVFKNGFERFSKKQKSKREASIPPFEQQFTDELWYEAYRNSWQQVEKQIKELNMTTYNRILRDLVNYVKECYNSHSVFYDGIIPCATLLTGINQPDHLVQFTALKHQLLSEVTSHVAIIYSQDANSVKQIIENMILQFINDDDSEDSDSEEPLDSPNKSMSKPSKIKKSQCNMTILASWFQELYGTRDGFNVLTPSKKLKTTGARNHLVIIIPDFESFDCEALQDFILILSGYAETLPFVLVFGVATSVSALHKSFPYHVSSRLLVQVFQSHSSTLYLNQVLENIFLIDKCPFHLSGKAFKLLIDVFLFYDFSVTGFIQSIKFCMMEHYYANKVNALCCPRENIISTISKMKTEDLEAVKHLPSFRPYVEAKPASTKISLLQNDDYFRIDLGKAIENLHDYLHNFHVTMKVLLAIVGNLPNAPLGKQIRELYDLCVSSSIVESPQYKQCILLIGFQSKDEFLDVLDKTISQFDGILKSHTTVATPKKRRLSLSSRKTENTNMPNSATKRMSAVKERLVFFKEKISNASLDCSSIKEEDETEEIIEKLNRQNLREKLLKASTKEKSVSEFDTIRGELIKYLSCEVFGTFLQPPNTQPFYELFFFSDVYKVKRHIVGTPRASIHTALNNPSAYLQCKCCELPSQEMILPTFPDLSIVYKLHLECGKLINLYDWLQAFLTIVDPVECSENDDQERREIHPEIQARFTRAVSELQFLGFVKTSKRKTDHVSRLTW